MLTQGGPLDVAIVGGGIAGLTIGYELLKRAPDMRWRLFEASGRLGGKVRTETVETDAGTFLIEAAADAFITQKPWARDLATELGLGDRLVPTEPCDRPVAILKRGRRIDLPEGVALVAPTKIGPFLRSPLLSWRGKLRAAFELGLPRRTNDADESVASFTRRRLGQEALDWLAEPLVAGIYNADPECLSLDATFPQWQAMERSHGSLIRGLRATTGRVETSPEAAFLSFRGGMGDLVDALVARVGGNATIESRVESIALDRDGRYRLRTTGGEIEAGMLVLAIPATAASKLLASLSPIAAAHLGQFRARASGVVTLAFRDKQIGNQLAGYGLVIPKRTRAPINAITVSSKKFPGRAPDGWTLLRVFFGGHRSPETLELGDDAVR